MIPSSPVAPGVSHLKSALKFGAQPGPLGLTVTPTNPDGAVGVDQTAAIWNSTPATRSGCVLTAIALACAVAVVTESAASTATTKRTIQRLCPARPARSRRGCSVRTEPAGTGLRPPTQDPERRLW